MHLQTIASVERSEPADHLHQDLVLDSACNLDVAEGTCKMFCAVHHARLKKILEEMLVDPTPAWLEFDEKHAARVVGFGVE